MSVGFVKSGGLRKGKARRLRGYDQTKKVEEVENDDSMLAVGVSGDTYTTLGRAGVKLC